MLKLVVDEGCQVPDTRMLIKEAVFVVSIFTVPGRSSYSV